MHEALKSASSLDIVHLRILIICILLRSNYLQSDDCGYTVRYMTRQLITSHDWLLVCRGGRSYAQLG
jgi:hypothetical protein